MACRLVKVGMFFCWYDCIYCKIHFYLEYANYSINFFKKFAFCKAEITIFN